MAKVKKALLSVIISGVILTGSIYGAYRYAAYKKPAIETAKVETLKYDYWADNVYDTLSGEIVTRDTQTIPLEGDQKLKKVFVKAGDEVSIGDPVLAYDTELIELKKEMSEIELQQLNIELAIAEKNISKLGVNPQNVKDADLIDTSKIKLTDANSDNANDGIELAGADDDFDTPSIEQEASPKTSAADEVIEASSEETETETKAEIISEKETEAQTQPSSEIIVIQEEENTTEPVSNPDTGTSQNTPTPSEESMNNNQPAQNQSESSDTILENEPESQNEDPIVIQEPSSEHESEPLIVIEEDPDDNTSLYDEKISIFSNSISDLKDYLTEHEENPDNETVISLCQKALEAWKDISRETISEHSFTDDFGLERYEKYSFLEEDITDQNEIERNEELYKRYEYLCRVLFVYSLKNALPSGYSSFEELYREDVEDNMEKILEAADAYYQYYFFDKTLPNLPISSDVSKDLHEKYTKKDEWGKQQLSYAMEALGREKEEEPETEKKTEVITEEIDPDFPPSGESESEKNAETELPSEVETSIPIEYDTDTDPETETNTDLETEIPIEIETETETETSLETESETNIETESEETESEKGTESEQIDSEKETESEQTESETEKKIYVLDKSFGNYSVSVTKTDQSAFENTDRLSLYSISDILGFGYTKETLMEKMTTLTQKVIDQEDIVWYDDDGNEITSKNNISSLFLVGSNVKDVNDNIYQQGLSYTFHIYDMNLLKQARKPSSRLVLFGFDREGNYVDHSYEPVVLLDSCIAFETSSYHYLYAVGVVTGNEEEETESLAEEISEEMTEDEFYGGDDYGDAGFEDAESKAAEIQDGIEKIRELRSKVREKEIEVRDNERKLKNCTVTATINGVVEKAGTLTEGDSDSFVVISGGKGMYVRGTINETKLDTLDVGSELKGTCYDTGESFTASIVEISKYPVDGDANYGESSGNASEYPFYAYIENQDAVVEGYVDYTFPGTDTSKALYIENYFIRTDETGRNYVLVLNEDDILEKRFIVTGAVVDEAATEIISGLSIEDYIAFPYGKGVEAGAKGTRTDGLSS